MRRLRSADDGVALVVFAVVLPVLLVLLSFCIEAGRLFYARALVQALADNAVLAGVQRLDFVALYQGNIQLDAAEAKQRVTEAFIENMPDSGAGEWIPLESLEVDVLNASASSPRRDGFTGRVIDYPTVCLVVRVRPRLLLGARLPSQLLERGVSITVHADASVEPRER